MKLINFVNNNVDEWDFICNNISPFKRHNLPKRARNLKGCSKRIIVAFKKRLKRKYELECTEQEVLDGVFHIMGNDFVVEDVRGKVGFGVKYIWC
jgi:hypothetical protein